MSAESPALLALDRSLKFELAVSEKIDLEIKGEMKKYRLIKIKVTGETTVGGDWDKTFVYLYAAPELKNLVVKTELIFPKGGRNCTLTNVSFDVSAKLFTAFSAYRRPVRLRIL
jgi:hypothetical protein